MRTITCPYCDMDVSLSTLDAQDGCCPECGAFIVGRSSFEDDDSWDDDYENDDLDNDFDDEDSFDDEDDFDDDFDDEDF